MIRNLTLREVLEMPEERREFIDGELYMPPSPGSSHQSTVSNLLIDIGIYLRSHPLGRVFTAPLDVVIADTLCQPDILFVSNERLSIITEANIQRAPDWLIEVVSPTSRKRDFETKKRLYLENGVREYWVIALDGQVVWVFSPENPEGEVYGKGELEPSVLPGLKVNVPALFQS